MREHLPALWLPFSAIYLAVVAGGQPCRSRTGVRIPRTRNDDKRRSGLAAVAIASREFEQRTDYPTWVER